MRYDSIFCNKHQDQNETQGKFPWKVPSRSFPFCMWFPLTHKKPCKYVHVPLTLSSTSLITHFQQFMDDQWQERAKIMKECNESSLRPSWTSYSFLCLFKMEAWYKLATGGKSHLVIKYSTRSLLCKFAKRDINQDNFKLWHRTETH